MDTLQASHATSSSFRSAPQSTAVASTRGNIVVPPKREIHGPGEPSTGLIRDGSPHRKQPPKREIHGPGEPSTGRYKYDHPGYQSTGQSHMPLPKRPHRSPNSDANKTCPVPGFARDVVTVRSAVDLLGGGPGRQSTARDYSGPCPRGGIDLSRYLGNDFDLRSSAAPGVRGRRGGERILPHFFTSKSWEHRNPSTENVAPRRAPGDDSTTARPRRRGVVTAIPPGHHSSGSFAGTERAVRRRNEETANPPPGPDRRVVVTPAPPEHHLSRYDATPLSRGTERVVRRRNEETANPPLQNQRRAVVTPTPPEHDAFRFAPRHRPEGCPGGTQGPRARRRVPGGPPRVIPKREKEARERSSEDRRHHSCTRTPPREREESSCRTSEVQLDRAHTSPYIGQLACQLSWKRSSSPVRCGMMLADGEGRGQNLVQFLRQNVGPKIHFSRKNGNFQRTLDRPRATSFSGPLAEFRGPGTLFRGVDFGGPETSKIRNSGTEGNFRSKPVPRKGTGDLLPPFRSRSPASKGVPWGSLPKNVFFLPFSPLNPKPEPPRTSFWYGSKGQVAGLPKKFFLKKLAPAGAPWGGTLAVPCAASRGPPDRRGVSKKIVPVRRDEAHLVSESRNFGTNGGPCRRRAPRRHDALSGRRTRRSISIGKMSIDASRRVLPRYPIRKRSDSLRGLPGPKKKILRAPEGNAKRSYGPISSIDPSKCAYSRALSFKIKFESLALSVRELFENVAFRTRDFEIFAKFRISRIKKKVFNFFLRKAPPSMRVDRVYRPTPNSRN
ncbi:hypothetical protein TNCT_17021 [Trichonephila clavata]|uniref:Uncharacterized protein n=1 Tax=Trichonephila clavata TaxID=2740835 RepID=A0A8X6K9F7_TRICU|nr:hypothetical protein TNCT_17021 [Trichonephila clavata]